MKVRKSVSRWTILFVTLVMGLFLLFLFTGYSYASEKTGAGKAVKKADQNSSELPYRIIISNRDKVYKIGSIYIKTTNNGTFYYSSGSDSNYMKFGEGDNQIIVNDSRAYYTVTSKKDGTSYLNYYSFDSGRKYRVCKLGSKWCYPGMPDYWYPSYVYGDYFYYTRDSEVKGFYKTYCIDSRLGKVMYKPVLGGIGDRQSSYLVLLTRWHTDVSPDTLRLYKVESNGKLKSVSKLVKYGCVGGFYGKYYYYGAYTGYGKKNDYNMNKISLYRIKKDGTGRKRIKTIKDKTGLYARIRKLKNGNCYITTTKHFYKVNLKNGKIKKKKIGGADKNLDFDNDQKEVRTCIPMMIGSGPSGSTSNTIKAQPQSYGSSAARSGRL